MESEKREKLQEIKDGKNKIEARFEDFHSYVKSPATSGMTPQEIKMGVPNEETNHLHLINNLTNTNTDEYECTMRDPFIPIANIVRIMRKILPSHAKISDEAKEIIQKCVSEFIGFITGEANERCKHEQRKTITADDIHGAISILGFDDYVDPLSFYLYKYREFHSVERGPMKKTYDQPNIEGFESSFRMTHLHEFFGSQSMIGCLQRDAQGAAGSSGAALAGLDTSGKDKEQKSDD